MVCDNLNMHRYLIVTLQLFTHLYSSKLHLLFIHITIRDLKKKPIIILTSINLTFLLRHYTASSYIFAQKQLNVLIIHFAS